MNFPAYDPEADRLKSCKCELCANIVAEETVEHFKTGVDEFHVCGACWSHLLQGQQWNLGQAWLRFTVAIAASPAFAWFIDRVLFPLAEWLHTKLSPFRKDV